MTQTVCVDEQWNNPGMVYVENDIVYSCTLNQTNIGENKNKFYIMQIIHDGNKYWHYIRYGRIGERGTILKDYYTSSDDCIVAFMKQFKSKTGNKWNTEFVKKQGKYYMSQMEKVIVKIEEIEPIEKPMSLLDPRVQHLLSLISDTSMMSNTLVSLNVDTKKLPLGKISNEQINKANDVLKIILNILNGNMDRQELETATNDFYNYIPYSCGRNRPPLISDIDTVGKYSEMLEELSNIVVATKIMSSSSNVTLDSVYHELNTIIEPLDKTNPMWNVISDYIVNTHGHTHKFSIELLDIYEIKRNGEYDKYTECVKNINNRQLLFHGSRLSNFCSILQRGLLLNPESLGVPIAGKMFGYGIYGANSCSKSFQYTCAETSNDIGALLLCEFALGNQYKCLSSDVYASKKKLDNIGCDSTYGQGKFKPKTGVTIDNVFIPNGKLEKSGVNSDLVYDECIIYDMNQLVIKYLILFKEC